MEIIPEVLGSVAERCREIPRIRYVTHSVVTPLPCNRMNREMLSENLIRNAGGNVALEQAEHCSVTAVSSFTLEWKSLCYHSALIAMRYSVTPA